MRTIFIDQRVIRKTINNTKHSWSEGQKMGQRSNVKLCCIKLQSHGVNYDSFKCILSFALVQVPCFGGNTKNEPF